MKVKKRSQYKKRSGKKSNTGGGSLHGLVSISICGILAIVALVGPGFLGNGEKRQVYAASDETSVISDGGDSEEYILPSGIAGVAAGIKETPVPGTKVKRIGTSCEEVVVGQRVQEVERNATEMNISTYMENTVDNLDSTVITMASSAKMMSDNDYQNLLKIVEAEAGGEDIKGRILVANVIMNRVKHEEFPDTVTDVIWEYRDGVPQFSPTYDGRINEVTISDDTKEAVKQALNGVDYSQGALFFIQKSAAESHNITWFEKDLKRLFKHGVHEFYTYPDENEKTTRQKDIVQMETNKIV